MSILAREFEHSLGLLVIVGEPLLVLLYQTFEFCLQGLGFAAIAFLRRCVPTSAFTLFRMNPLMQLDAMPQGPQGVGFIDANNDLRPPTARVRGILVAAGFPEYLVPSRIEAIGGRIVGIAIQVEVVAGSADRVR